MANLVLILDTSRRDLSRNVLNVDVEDTDIDHIYQYVPDSSAFNVTPQLRLNVEYLI